MLFISIPVHENPAVVLEQCNNIRKYSDSIVVLHVSRSNPTLKSQLMAGIKNRNLLNTYINPTSVQTSWGDIFNAHIENIKFIRQFAHRDDVIAFEASNDMHIRKGLSDYATSKLFLFNERNYSYIQQAYYWWPINRAFQDNNFMALLKKIFGTNKEIFGSQIEGSVYQADFLFNLVDLLKKLNISPHGNLARPYPREEVWFPTFAHYLGIRSQGNPYIYSEVNIYDASVYEQFRRVEKLLPCTLLSMPTKKIVSALLRRLPFYRVTPELVNMILENKITPTTVIDHHIKWTNFVDPEELYGIKRVPRSLDCKLRAHINSLNFV